MNGDKIKNEQEKQDILRSIFDQSFQFIGLMTLDGTLIDANRTAIKFTGFKEEDVLGKPFWETPWWTHSKELQEKLKEAVKKSVQGEIVRFEATHLDSKKQLHFVDFSLKPVKDESGKIIYLIPEGRDITEYKKAEEALKNSEEKYRNIFENNQVGMFRSKIDGSAILDVNKKFAEIFGYLKEEMLGKPSTMLWFSLEAREKMVQQVKKEKGGELVNYEADFITKKKEHIICLLSLKFFPKEGILEGSIVDVTKRKSAEESLRQSEEKFRIIFDHANDGMLLVDAETKMFAMANLSISEMTGYTKEELEKMGVQDIHPEEKLPYVFSQFEKLVKKEIRVTSDIPILKKNKEIMYADVVASNIKIGQKDYVVGFFRDTTERIESKKELQNKIVEMEKLNRLMIGRELKMVELKKEIAQLKGEKV